MNRLGHQKKVAIMSESLRNGWLVAILVLFASGCTETKQPNTPQPLPMPGNVVIAPGMQFRTGMSIAAREARLPVLFRDREPADAAVDALARIGAPSLPPLCTALSSPDPEIRKRAATALARIGPDAAPAVPDLIAALQDDNQDVRKQVIRALGQIGPAAASAVSVLAEEMKTKTVGSEAVGTGNLQQRQQSP